MAAVDKRVLTIILLTKQELKIAFEVIHFVKALLDSFTRIAVVCLF
jgi:hypothetical protein